MADSYLNSVVLHIPGATDALDKSVTHKVVTSTGDVYVASGTSPFGSGSLSFDGSGDYLSAPGNDFVFGTGDFTVEGWVKTTSTNKVLVDYYSSGSTWQVMVSSSGKLDWYGVLASTTSINTGSWVHFEAARESGTLRLFVNGTLDGSTSFATNLDTLVSVIGVGAQVTIRNATYDFTGSMFDVRITKGVARHTASFTAPTAPFETGDQPTVDRELTGTNAIDSISSTGTISASVPRELTGTNAIDSISSTGTISASVPTVVELSGSSALSDLSGSGTIGVLPAVSMVVPTATLEGTIGQRYLMATVPSAELTASMVAYEGLSLDAQVPVASMSAWAGLRMDGVVPAATVQASGAVPNTLRIDAEIPRVTSTGVVLLGRSLSLNGALPAASMSGHTGLQLIGVVPSATVDGHIVTGGAYRLNATVPMATMQAAASSVNMLRLNGTVPVVTRANWLSIDKPVPAAGVFARASQVVATTRLAYSFTMSNSAMTRYPAYPFIQVIRMGDAYYGIAEDGLYEVGGETDNGVGIPWAWETCMTDFGQPERKTVVSAYLGGYVPQSMSYTIKSGDEPTGTNAHATTATTVLRNHRQKFGLGRKSRFFAFGLSAAQGRVAIESVEFEVATMSRRI